MFHFDFRNRVRCVLVGVILAITNFWGFGQTDSLADLKVVYHMIDDNGRLLELKRKGPMFDLNANQVIPYDTTEVSRALLPDTLIDTTYSGGYKGRPISININYYIIDSNELYPVKCLTYYWSNDQLAEELPCNGSNYLTYYRSGQISQASDSCNCPWGCNCLAEGYTKFYYPNGIMESEGHLTSHLKDGVKRAQSFYVGEWKYYDQNGRLIKTTIWDDYYPRILIEKTYD